MQTVQHPLNFEVNDENSFQEWILTESYIRSDRLRALRFSNADLLNSTTTFAIMLDNAFGIFNNFAPRFQWAEIDLTFPSDDRFFAVANYDDLVAHSLFPVSKMNIKDAFLVLFSPPEKADEGFKVLRTSNLTALDMQMLIHCESHHFLLLHLKLMV